MLKFIAYILGQLDCFDYNFNTGGDVVSAFGIPSLADCQSACFQMNPGCQTFIYSPGFCYLKDVTTGTFPYGGIQNKQTDFDCTCIPTWL